MMTKVLTIESLTAFFSADGQLFKKDLKQLNFIVQKVNFPSSKNRVMIYDTKSFKPESIDNPELLRKILDVLPLPVFYRDIRGTYLMCNSSFEKFIGRSSEQILGKTVYEVHSRETADLYSQRDNELAELPGDQVYEAKARHKDGTVHDVIINKAVIRGNEGQLIGIVGSIFDITDRKKAERKLEHAKESMIISSHMLQKIRAGIIIMDQDFKVIDSNESFAQLMGEETSDLFETIPGLKGADVKVLVPEVIFKMIASIMSSGENELERDLKYQNKLLHVSVVTIYKNRVVGAVIRDMSAPMLVRDEIISRAERVNKKNIETVQKIAFLLGENAAQTEELLYSIIQSYRYDDDE